MLHANVIWLCFIEPELLTSDESENRDFPFSTFLPRDLDLDPMTSIYELDPYFLQI